MKEIKLEMKSERDAQSGKERPNQPELGDKSEVELKNTLREENIKIEKEDSLQIEEDINKINFLDYKNISGKDSNYKGKKINIKQYNKNSNKRNKVNKKKNTYLIILLFFNLMIEYKSSRITLKIKGPGFSNILSSLFFDSYEPFSVLINGIRNYTITNRYYFNGVNNLVELEWNIPIDTCYQMFYECSNITEIDLSDFDTSEVSIMWSMFHGCSQLYSLDFSNFDTSQVTDMESMFHGCSQLSTIDLSNFQTSNVKWMNKMFSGCSQLYSLDLYHFDTSEVTTMSSMFSGCSQLYSLDLNHFVTSKITDMSSMFSGCSQLSSLDLSNFDTSKVTTMISMFNGCSNLEYINLKNFIENNSLTVSNIFDNVPDNIVLCLNENSVKILGKIIDKNCYTLDCSNNWKINQKKIINKRDICFDNFNNNILYKCEYHGKYYEYYKNDNFMNNSTIKYCQCEINKCSTCSNIPFLHLEYDLYEVDDNDNLNGYRKCYKDTTGYYLDINYNIYKRCYYSCEKCEVEGNNKTHNCIECSNNYPQEFKINNNYSNCFENCSYYYYFDEYNNYQCTINNSCPNEYPLLENKECKLVNKINNVIQDLINNEQTKKDEINYYGTVLKNIEDIYTSKKYNTSYLDEGNDEIIEMEKMKVILTTLQNQKNNINSDTINIDLGECENSLRRTYNLSNDQNFYIKMLEISQEGMKIPKVEYDVYAKLNGKNLTKLNLNSCQNNKIFLLVPVDNVDNVDKLNSKSGYYNDFCYTATTDSGTDITLTDRKNEYPSNAACQDDCDFVDYNYTSKKAKCSCESKESSLSFKDMNIDKNKLLNNFKNIKNIVNFNILKCVKVLFSKKGISENVGSYILIAIIFFHTITLFVFYIKQLDSLINKIKYIIFTINNNKSKKEEEKNQEIIKIESKDKKRLTIMNDNNIQNGDKNNTQFMKKRKMSLKKKKIKIQTGIINQININNNKINNIMNNFLNNIVDNNDLNSNDIIIINRNKVEKHNLFEKNWEKDEDRNLKIIIDYRDDEINNLSYDLALLKDKRTYWKFYFSLIRTKHEFIYTFFYNRDYNSKIIKIDLFLIGFALNYFVNGLFFDDATMHNVYENKGLFDVSYQLPIIVYSSFISMFLGGLVQMLGLSNDSILDFKHIEEKNNVNEKGEKLIKNLKIKFVIYFILCYILLLFFWYYISMFDAIYRNTQYILLKDTLIGFAFSFFTPFVIYLIPGIFRLPALAAPQKNRNCLYNFSKVFTIL